jgi:hypothetical protein
MPNQGTNYVVLHVLQPGIQLRPRLNQGLNIALHVLQPGIQPRPRPNQGQKFGLHVLQPGIRSAPRPKWGQKCFGVRNIDVRNPQKNEP